MTSARSCAVIRINSFSTVPLSLGACPRLRPAQARVEIRAIRKLGRMSISHLKSDSDSGDSVDGQAVLRRWTKPDPPGGLHRILVQSVPQTADDPQNAEISRRGKLDFEHDIAFDVRAPRFLGVRRTGLVQNFE